MTVTSREEISSMMKTAERLDAEGHTELAKQMDITIAGLVATAEKEDKESSGPKITGSQKKACAAFVKAAERVEKAFGRGAPRGAARKFDALAEEVTAVECDFLND